MIEELLTLDPTCPWCGELHDVDEVYDGSECMCGSCGRWLVAVGYTDGTMMMTRLGRLTGDERTGRQRTRARWRKQGRR